MLSILTYFVKIYVVLAVNICYLIDDTEEKYEMQHSIEEKIQLVRNISRCLRNKGAVAKIATVVYDNDSAKLGFNFKNIDDILNDGFQKIIAKQRQRRNTQGMFVHLSFYKIIKQ